MLENSALAGDLEISRQMLESATNGMPTEVAEPYFEKLNKLKTELELLYGAVEALDELRVAIDGMEDEPDSSLAAAYTKASVVLAKLHDLYPAESAEA